MDVLYFTYPGLTGRVRLDKNADRNPDYWFWHCPPDKAKCEPYASVSSADQVMGFLYCFIFIQRTIYPCRRVYSFL